MEGVSSKEWQNLSSGGSVQGADTATLAYSSIESCSEGVYRCVVTNVAGEDISECADYIIGEYMCHAKPYLECGVMACSTHIQVKSQSCVFWSMN